MLKRHRHTPAHLFIDNTPYFITGGTYLKRPLLAEIEIKEQLIEFTHRYFDNYDWEIHHWVVLDNHLPCDGKKSKGKRPVGHNAKHPQSIGFRDS